MSARWDWVQQMLRQSYPPPHPVLGTNRQYRRPGEVISARLALASSRDAARGGAKAKLNAKVQAGAGGANGANREARVWAPPPGAAARGARHTGPRAVGPTASGRRTAPRFMAPTRSIQQKYGPVAKSVPPGHSHAPLRAGLGAGTGTGTSTSNSLLTHPLQTMAEADHLQNWSHAAPRRYRPLPQPPPLTAPDPRCAAGPFTEHNVGFGPSWRRAKPSGSWMDEHYNFRLGGGGGDPLADPPHMGIGGRYADAGPRVGKYLDPRGASGPEDIVWVDAASASDSAGPLSGWNPNGVGGRCKWNHGVGDPLLPPGWQGPAGSAWPRHEMAVTGALVPMPVAQLHPLANGAPPGFALVPVFVPNTKRGDAGRERGASSTHKSKRDRSQTPRQRTEQVEKKSSNAGGYTRAASARSGSGSGRGRARENTKVSASKSVKQEARQAGGSTDLRAAKHVRRKEAAKHVRQRDKHAQLKKQQNQRPEQAAAQRDGPWQKQRQRQSQIQRKEQKSRASEPSAAERPPTATATVPLSARIATGAARGRSWRLRPK